MLNTFAPSCRFHQARRLMPVLRLVAVSTAVLLAVSCVTQSRYDESIQELQYYQRSFHDLDSSVATLEARLAEQDTELQALHGGDSSAIEAGLSEGIDARMTELRAIMSRLESHPGDVEVLKVEGGYGLRLSDAILFESGRADLRPEGRELVLRLASEIRQKPFQRVEVRGHTDSLPVKKPATLERFPRGNLELSVARAIEVADLLSAQGNVDRSKLIVSGYASSEPLAANDSPENRQRNRRVELFVLD